MSSISNLPKSLVSAVSDVVTRSEQATINTRNRIFNEGLKRFGVSSIAELTETDAKALYSWVQSKLQEASCGCGEDVTEDDMPGDSVYHKDDDESAEKKTEIDESSDQKKKIKAELAKLKKELDDVIASSDANGTWPEKKIISLFTKMKNLTDKKNSLKESVALEADEIATNGAVGVTDADEQLPVHADVLRDSSPVDGKTEFRLFVQFNTNTLPLIVPPVTLPGAPTIDALRDVVEGLPFFCDVCERALSVASDSPHEEPSHNGGVVSESLTLSQTDRLVVASVKRLLKTTDVHVIYNNTEYLARVPSSTKGEFYHIGISLEPSQKRLGKQNWVAYDQTISDQDPNSGQKLAAPDFSLPFDQGDIQVSLRKLQELLAHVARNVAAGSYASQEPSF